PRETSDFKNVGFFEVATQLEETTGRAVARISRWDHTKPITYYVSANTPPEYVQAVKEGVLYWNLAFGREVLRAEVAPAGVTAPDPRHNIIQWVPNDTAGFAYADGLMDPRTGEILHAQVYLTSVFGVSPRSKMPANLRKLRKDLKAPAAPGVALSALHSSRLCELSEGDKLAHDLERLRAMDTTDASFLRAVQDYIREVTAHEVGHTLGLRHNFAGSLAMNLSLAERDELFVRYLKTGDVPALDKVFTSSYMEYSALAEAVLSAAQAQTFQVAFPYDKLAIRWAYENEEIDPATAPLFCTDGHAALSYRDCVRFDSGAQPIPSNRQKLQLALDSLPLNFAEAFIRAKTAPDARDRVPFAKLELQPKDYLTAINEALTDQIAWLNTEPPKSIAIERRFPFVSPFNRTEVLDAERAWIAEQVKAEGGVQAVLFGLLPGSLSPSLVTRSNERLAAYLAREDVRRGIGYDGQPYELSSEEIDFLKRTGAKLFAQLELAVLDKTLDLLAAARFNSPALGYQLEAPLGELAQIVVLAQKGEPRALFEPFLFDRATRVKAAKLLSRSIGGSIPDWSAASRAGAAVYLQTMLKLVSKDMTLTREQAQWVTEQEEMVGLLLATAKM
ncbi:MAG: zinc-dependent metalloprotease, partial [Oligoflexia bacterium]|nr:zinc-dependent metalloprotease [Oligoflexia bacterium]